MASPTQWTQVWVNSGSWWWTGRPGVLWFMGLQRVRHDWATELNWTEVGYCLNFMELVQVTNKKIEKKGNGYACVPWEESWGTNNNMRREMFNLTINQRRIRYLKHHWDVISHHQTGKNSKVWQDQVVISMAWNKFNRFLKSTPSNKTQNTYSSQVHMEYFPW